MTTPSDAPQRRTMSRQVRERGLNNGKAVGGGADIVAGWQARSASLRKARVGLSRPPRWAYRERNRIDFFSKRSRTRRRCCSSRAVQHRAKATFAVFDEGVMTHDINVALGYTLAPDAGRIKSSS